MKYLLLSLLAICATAFNTSARNMATNQPTMKLKHMSRTTNTARCIPTGTVVHDVEDLNTIFSRGVVDGDTLYFRRTELITVELSKIAQRKYSASKNRSDYAAWEKEYKAQQVADAIERNNRKRSCVRDNTPDPVAKDVYDIINKHGAYIARIDDVTIYV